MPTGILVIAGGPHFLDRRNCLLLETTAVGASRPDSDASPIASIINKFRIC